MVEERRRRLTARPALFTPAFIAIAVAELAYFTAGGIEIPVAPGFAAEVLGADAVGVGLAIGAFGATALILRPIAGRAADRGGRRRLMVAGALVYAAATAAHAVAPSLEVMIGLRLVLGAAEAFFFVASLAAVADIAPASRRGEAMSYSTLALYLGIAFGPSIGDALVRTGGYPVAWLGGAALALIAAAVASRIPEDTPAHDQGVHTGLIHPAALLPGLVIFALVAPMAAYFAFVRFQAIAVGLGDTGPVLLAFGLVVVGCRVVFARLPDRVEPTRLARGALAAAAVGLIGIVAVPTPLGLVAGSVLFAVGVAFVTPAVLSWTVARAPADERGAALGTFSAFIDIGFAVGPIVAGFAVAAAGYPAAFATGAAIAATGAIVILAATRRASRPAAVLG